MAIGHHHHHHHHHSVSKGVQSDGKREMTMDQFIEWLWGFDKDNDGRISQDELKEAVRATGGWFSTWKSKRGVKSADLNRDGFIDQNEITRLVEFAQKQLGMRIVGC
ncbi:calcium-binding protein CML24-like [Actinidia eriantha]|uniref:calcium-binding protein CML24-like n=1 Tax=Actinidia eriantha TaxID=165200 RepID=UPI00258EF826|nr:calcium-binding protein CML24-like [Actinidia eriantha]